jgi:transglutaminase-like putative cysteine protease
MKSKYYYLSVFLIFMLYVGSSQATLPEKFQKLIDKGEFSKAQELMRKEIAVNLGLSSLDRLETIFEIERLERIKKDFTKSGAEVVDYIKKYIPDVTDKDIERWEKEKSLEYMIIDGQKKYFNRAASNLFLINKEAKKIKQEKEKGKPKEPQLYNRLQGVREIIKLAKEAGGKYLKPTRVRIKYSLAVNEDAVPEGKIIRCWLPFPREKVNRQTDIKLISASPEKYIMSDNRDYLQRTIYFEAPAVKGQKTTFNVIFEYTGYAFYNKINPEEVKPVQLNEELRPFIQERPPHIVFSEELKELSKKIVGQETNPYKIAQRLFKWIHDNIPWASARDYSTIRNISAYCYQNMHGDCGIQTILFMTLCRMNGIPTKWQSGWTTTPGRAGMHDWGEIYFEPYGWLPVDATYGLLDSEDDNAKWFYLGNMENYRFIVNDDYTRPLCPAKIYPRSDTVDFQRGEFEWEGGNLFFDQWDYNYEVEYIK